MRRSAVPFISLLSKIVLIEVAVFLLSLVSLFVWRFSQTDYMEGQYQSSAAVMFRLTGDIFPNTPVTQARWRPRYAHNPISYFPVDYYPSQWSLLERAARGALLRSTVAFFPIQGGATMVGYDIAPHLYAIASLACVAAYRWGIRANRTRLLAIGRGRAWQPLPPFLTHWIIALALSIPALALPRMLFGFWFYYDVNVEMHHLWPIRIAIGGVHIAAVVWCIGALEVGRYMAGWLFAPKKLMPPSCCSRCGYGKDSKEICPECGQNDSLPQPRSGQALQRWLAILGLFFICSTTPLWITWLAALSELI